MRNFDDINTRNIKLKDAYNTAIKAEESRDFSPMVKGITVGLSSGTSGSRGVFLASAKERAQWVSVVLDRVIGFTLRKRKVAFFLRANSNLYNSVQSSILKFYFFDLLYPVSENILRLQQLQPTIIVAQPSMLMEIGKAIERKELAIYPKKVIAVAEVLTHEDNIYLQKAFNQIIHQVYQCTEGFLACTCKYGTLHFNEDFLQIEKNYIDCDQQRFHPVITDLLRTTQPIIRYELDDIIIEKKKCPCGSNMMAIEQIEGRSDDILIFENIDKTEVKIFPDFFRKAIITSVSEIEDYSLIQKTKKHLDLFIQSPAASAFEQASRAIQLLLEKHSITRVTIHQSSDKGHHLGNKLRRIRNDI